MPKFMLLLQEAPTEFQSYTPEQMQAIIGRYRDWKNGLIATGQFSSGFKLTDEGGRHLRSQNGRVEVMDGPYAEAKEVLGGYFVLNAAGYDEAVEIAKGCPHLEYGWIEVRQIDEP